MQCNHIYAISLCIYRGLVGLIFPFYRSMYIIWTISGNFCISYTFSIYLLIFGSLSLHGILMESFCIGRKEENNL